MSRLPVIVGFGGVNAAGRLSAHHGYRRMRLPSRLLARVGIPVGRRLAGLGLKKLGNKRLGRWRYVAAQVSASPTPWPVIGGDDGRAVFHVK